MVLNFLRNACEGLHMLSRHLRVRGKQFTPIADDAVSICEKTLLKLWTGRYYKTDLGNYPHFYSRDFGIVIASLLRLGKKDEVRKTLEYAMSTYQKYGEITTYINRWDKPVNFPNVFSPDSVAYMFRSLAILNDKNLINKHKSFLQSELNRFYDESIDKKTGLIKRNTHFGGMRDHSIRDSSCYDNTMAAMLSKMASTLGLNNPLEKFDYQKILIDNFWTGEYFKDDLSSKNMSADANIFPFWLGVITDSLLKKKMIASLQRAKLDKPFPIRYVKNNHEAGKTIPISFLSYKWQSISLWPMAGLPFIAVVYSADILDAKKYLLQYKEEMEYFKTFLEVYDGSKKPYNSPFFSSGEGMIWCALWLDLYTR